jgi:uncharacterized protein YcnI
MNLSVKQICLAAALAAMTAAAAEAHIVIAPNQSTQGATEKFTLRVPTEGTVATVAAEVDIPAGVVVETVAMPAGWKYELKRDADKRIIGIVWTMTIPPGEFAEFAFTGRLPREGTQVVWTLRQKFADGTVSDWTKTPAGAIRPTAITKMAPRALTK